MKTEKLKEFFEEQDFIVHHTDGEEDGEIEKWTNGGVDMNIYLSPFNSEEFKKYVNDFDIDEQIDNYRQDDRYKKDFTIRESLKDFTDFHKHLKQIVKKLPKGL